jgi:hypothetical protein
MSNLQPRGHHENTFCITENAFNYFWILIKVAWEWFSTLEVDFWESNFPPTPERRILFWDYPRFLQKYWFFRIFFSSQPSTKRPHWENLRPSQKIFSDIFGYSPRCREYDFNRLKLISERQLVHQLWRAMWRILIQNIRVFSNNSVFSGYFFEVSGHTFNH